jgi:hypothetical protein
LIALQMTSSSRDSRHVLGLVRRIYQPRPCTRRRALLIARSPFRQCPPIGIKQRWRRNINLLSIVYAFRPRLRDRLTLGGFTFPRNPQACGGQDSHLPYRYSSRHNHFQPPTRLLAVPLAELERSPTARRLPKKSTDSLLRRPAYSRSLSVHEYSTGKLLRTF